MTALLSMIPLVVFGGLCFAKRNAYDKGDFKLAVRYSFAAGFCMALALMFSVIFPLPAQNVTLRIEPKVEQPFGKIPAE